MKTTIVTTWFNSDIDINLGKLLVMSNEVDIYNKPILIDSVVTLGYCNDDKSYYFLNFKTGDITNIGDDKKALEVLNKNQIRPITEKEKGIVINDLF